MHSSIDHVYTVLITATVMDLLRHQPPLLEEVQAPALAALLATEHSATQDQAQRVVSPLAMVVAVGGTAHTVTRHLDLKVVAADAWEEAVEWE